ncbi:uncharacterized protein EV154DRAFT_494640 [Mucor mucedo]|uniref:uncharacterized protein n=1 Tax=Mucor mucedo TaxID=29922 RepID=UPI00221F44E5|nr:uncharacterized protein EV154DRAFT_494640 [Mucor mucedo]KAI7895700.1 hypothetical protein EV154DRAFT_494640 [Mucor mucedo]
MFIQELPTEIVRMIFQELHKRTLFVCMRVCKAWQGPATEFFYEVIVVGENNRRKFTINYEKPDQFAKLERWTRTLIIHDDFNYLSTQYGIESEYESDGERVQFTIDCRIFFKLLNELNNLKTLDLTESHQAQQYLEWIDESEVEDIPEFEAIFPGRLTGYDVDFGEHDMFRIYYKLRNSLKYMKIDYKYLVNGKKPIRGASLLSDFTKLSKLVIEDMQPDSDVSCVNILNSCTTLHELHLKHKCEVPDSVYDQDINRKVTKLKSLKLEIPKLTSACLRYLLRCVVTDNLENLEIALSSEDILTWIDREDEEILMEFARKLNSVKTIMFKGSYDCAHSNPSPCTKASMTKVYSVMNALKGKRLIKRQNLSFNDTNYRGPKMGISDQKSLSYMCDINCSLEEDKLDWLIPDTSVLVNGLDTVNHVHFSVNESREQFSLGLLNLMMTNYPNIKTVDINTTTPKSILKLESKFTTFDMDLIGPCPSQETFDLISTCVPRIGHLNIERLIGYEKDRNHDNLILDLTRLNDLQRVSIVINYTPNFKNDIFGVQFKFPGSDMVHCHFISHYRKESTKGFEKVPMSSCHTHYSSSMRRVFIQCHGVKNLRFSESPRHYPIAHMRVSFEISK